MSISAFSSAGSAAALVKLTSGEYTAASVAADPKDAARLWLVKESDGNYGTATPAPTGGSAAAQSSSNVLTGLDRLCLGGEWTDRV